MRWFKRRKPHVESRGLPTYPPPVIRNVNVIVVQADRIPRADFTYVKPGDPWTAPEYDLNLYIQQGAPCASSAC